MINKVAKGRRVENIARDKLKTQGYLVDKKVRTRFSSPDFFGAFDLLAIKGNKVKFVQVKSNPSDFYKARKELKEWLKMYNLFINAELWLYFEREWRIEKIGFKI